MDRISVSLKVLPLNGAVTKDDFGFSEHMNYDSHSRFKQRSIAPSVSILESLNGGKSKYDDEDVLDRFSPSLRIIVRILSWYGVKGGYSTSSRYKFMSRCLCLC